MLVGARVQQKQIEDLEMNEKSHGKQIKAAEMKHAEYKRRIKDAKAQKNEIEVQVCCNINGY